MFVLVSQGIEIYRTENKEEAERVAIQGNTKYADYLQECEANGERVADNFIFLYDVDKCSQCNQEELKGNLEICEGLCNDCYNDKYPY